MYVSITLRPSLHIFNINPIYVKGEKHLDLHDATIHGVTEKTCPDMLVRPLRFRCWRHATRSNFVSLALNTSAKTKSQHIPYWRDALPKYPPPDVWSLIHAAKTAIHRIPSAGGTSTGLGRSPIPNCKAAKYLNLRYFTVSLPPDKRWILTTPNSTEAKPALKTDEIWNYIL